MEGKGGAKAALQTHRAAMRTSPASQHRRSLKEQNMPTECYCNTIRFTSEPPSMNEICEVCQADFEAWLDSGEADRIQNELAELGISLPIEISPLEVVLLGEVAR